jgi:hypothetical protein
MMAALAGMAVQAALAVMAAQAALAVMSAWLAGQAVLSARGEAMQVRRFASLAFLAVVSRVAVARRRTASVVGAS